MGGVGGLAPLVVALKKDSYVNIMYVFLINTSYTYQSF